MVFLVGLFKGKFVDLAQINSVGGWVGHSDLVAAPAAATLSCFQLYKHSYVKLMYTH